MENVVGAVDATEQAIREVFEANLELTLKMLRVRHDVGSFAMSVSVAITLKRPNLEDENFSTVAGGKKVF